MRLPRQMGDRRHHQGLGTHVPSKRPFRCRAVKALHMAARSRSLGSGQTAPTCAWEGADLGSGHSAPLFVSARSAATAEDSRPKDLEFQTLVDSHYAPLYRFALSLSRTEHDAADLVQDTFLAWASKGHQLLDRSKAKSWLFTTLHRRFLEGQRRSTRFQHLEITSVEAELPDLEPELLNQLDAQIVVDLLAQVDPQFRAAVALCYLEDYSYEEVAAILEVPLGTVKSRISRGIAQLKALLKQTVSSLNSIRKAS